MAEEKVGVVTHYFTHLEVAAIALTEGPLNVGDRIHFKGHTSDFTQTVDSIQLEHESVQQATVGENVGVKVLQHVREHDEVFKIVD